MKKRKLTKPIFALALLFGVLSWGGCSSECTSPCPPVGEQPKPYEFTKWEKQRFPYSKFESLTFKVTEPGRVDTITLYREKYDSFYTNIGDKFIPPCGCEQAYSARYKNYTAMYGDRKNPDRLIFQNQNLSMAIKIKWEGDSSGISQIGLNKFFGRQNEDLNHDTVSVLGKDYFPTSNGTGLSASLDSVTLKYNYIYGFIFIKDHKPKKLWEFISAEQL